MNNGFNLGVQHKVFNNEVRKRRIEKGFSQKALAIACGFGLSKINHLENFRFYPTPEEAELLAEILETKPEILFPDWLRLFKPKKTTVITEHIITEPLLSVNEKYLLSDGNDLEDSFDNELLTIELNKQINTLSDREKRVLEARFGLKDGRVKTLEEVGRLFGLTKERIRGIESKGLRKMRHPTRTKKLKQFV